MTELETEGHRHKHLIIDDNQNIITFERFTRVERVTGHIKAEDISFTINKKTLHVLVKQGHFNFCPYISCQTYNDLHINT